MVRDLCDRALCQQLARGMAPTLRSEGLPAVAHRTAEPVNASADALHESGAASRFALQVLATAHQDLATRSAKTLTDAIQRDCAVKSPAEFIELQQKQIKEGVLDALSGSQQIAN